MYLEPAQSRKVIRDVVEYLELGGQVFFDVLGTVLQRHTSQVQWLKSSGVKFSWGVDNPEEVEELHEKLKLKLVGSKHWDEYMHVGQRMSCAPPWCGETATKVALKLLSSFDDFAQALRFDFEPDLISVAPGNL